MIYEDKDEKEECDPDQLSLSPTTMNDNNRHKLYRRLLLCLRAIHSSFVEVVVWPGEPRSSAQHV